VNVEPAKPPLLPVLGALAFNCSWSFEVMALGISLLTHGARPVRGKLWAITIATIAATVCHLTLKQHFRVHRRYVRRIKLKMNDPHVWAILAFTVCYLTFIGWVFMP
jgi:hypothetical protein